jgi:hypothetical protein
VLEPNSDNEEIVLIDDVDTTVTPPVFFFTPARTHTMALDPSGNRVPIPATFRGNPGPWPNYNPRTDRRVVPHFSVID